MNPADLRAFAARDWAAVERSKREYWAERAEDLRHHLHLRDQLDRAARALAGR